MKAKTKFTKLWSILLALAMVVGMLPIAALAAGSASATADFSTDPTTALALLNAAKTGTTDSTWDNDTKTLTLGGVNFETTAATAVKLPDGAKIVLNGENTIKGGSGSKWRYGIEGEGSITVQGYGTLNVTGGEAVGESYSYGIAAWGNLTITGGTVTATGGNATDGNSASYGIYVPDGGANVNISGGIVTATGGKVANGNDSYGIYGLYRKVNITGGALIAKTSSVGNSNYAAALNLKYNTLEPPPPIGGAPRPAALIMSTPILNIPGAITKLTNMWRSGTGIPQQRQTLPMIPPRRWLCSRPRKPAEQRTAHGIRIARPSPSMVCTL